MLLENAANLVRDAPANLAELMVRAMVELSASWNRGAMSAASRSIMHCTTRGT